MMKAALSAPLLRTLTRDGVGLAGAGYISYGVWCIFPPAGMIVVGGMLLTAAVLLARRS